jgi:hypothetical protein
VAKLRTELPIHRHRVDESPLSHALCHGSHPTSVVVQLCTPFFHVAASALYRLDGCEQIGAATGCLLCRCLLSRERNLHMSHLGAHSPLPRYRGSIDGAPGHALPIDHDFMPFRGGCFGSAEISDCWTRNLYLLPDLLSKARSAWSGETEISKIKRRRGV